MQCLRDCCFILCRHCNDGRNTKLYRLATLFVISSFSLIFSFPSFSQKDQETVKIGFLIRDKNDIAIQQAAQLAIEYANAQGGYKGKKFELITKSCDGPWGITSKQAVALVFEDKVPIVVTALDGRNAHLAEQVTAKSHVVMLSTLSSDPTLSRAYVPWYFRMVPDDKQQAQQLVKEIYENNKDRKVTLFSFDDYDGKKAAEAFVAEVKVNGYRKPDILSNTSHMKSKGNSINSPSDVVILAGSSKESNQIVPDLKPMQLYAFLNFYNFISQDQPGELAIKTTFSSWKNDALWIEFREMYKTKYTQIPTPAVAFVYDGISLAIEAIRKFGPDSEGIRKGFKDLDYRGITGDVEFDNLGNRVLKPTN